MTPENLAMAARVAECHPALIQRCYSFDIHEGEILIQAHYNGELVKIYLGSAGLRLEPDNGFIVGEIRMADVPIPIRVALTE